jgi:hypothetical protein
MLREAEEGLSRLQVCEVQHRPANPLTEKSAPVTLLGSGVVPQ